MLRDHLSPTIDRIQPLKFFSKSILFSKTYPLRFASLLLNITPLLFLILSSSWQYNLP